MSNVKTGYRGTKLSCGGGGCCPSVMLNPDGTMDITDNDVKPPQEIHFTIAQISELMSILREHFAPTATPVHAAAPTTVAAGVVTPSPAKDNVTQLYVVHV